MLKNIKYETKDINEVVLDLAEEIKMGWKLFSFCRSNIEASLCYDPKITIEVALTNNKQYKSRVLRGGRYAESRNVLQYA